MQSRLRKLGVNFQRGDKFVISIDCDEVLGDLALPSGKRDEELGSIIGRDEMLFARDGDSFPLSRNKSESYMFLMPHLHMQSFAAIDKDMVYDENVTLSYLLAPFGDLKPGM
jgi:hypothetical protein